MTIEGRDLQGALVASVALPTAAAAGNQPFTLTGNSTTEGVLNRSSATLTLAGYAAVPGIASVSGLTSTPRVVARIADTGAVDTSTQITDAYLVNSIRAAATIDGTGYWTSGTASSDAGIRYVVQGSTGASASVFSAIQNLRAVHIFGGQLYTATQSGTVPDGGLTYSRIFAVGTGTPMSNSSATYLPGVNVVNPNSFALVDANASVTGLDTLYSSDGTNGAGVRKYTFDGTVWTEQTALTAGIPASTQCYNVAARVYGSTTVVLCAAANNTIYRFDDLGTSAPTATAIASAPAGTNFRGIAFVN